MRRLLAILGLFGGLVQAAEAPPEPPVPAALSFISEHAVEGMRGGNLSGLAWCGGALWTVSDRDDDRLYRLQPSAEGSDQPGRPRPRVSSLRPRRTAGCPGA